MGSPLSPANGRAELFVAPELSCLRPATLAHFIAFRRHFCHQEIILK